MIVRKKNIKNVPLSQMSFQIDIEPEDVYRTLRKYLTPFARQFPDMAQTGAFLYSRHDLETLLSNYSVAHHFSPSARKIIVNWMFNISLNEKLITPVTELRAKSQDITSGEAFSMSAELLLK